jgi:hypothetical protein
MSTNRTYLRPSAGTLFDSLVDKIATDLRLPAIQKETAAKVTRGSKPPPPPPQTVLEWAEKNRRLEGAPFSLERFEPLRALYEDTHDTIVVMKPAQRGVSEWAISYTGWALDVGATLWAPPGIPKDGVNVGYIFPTQDALRDFSKERFGTLGKESDSLGAMFGKAEYDGVTFKQVGNSFLYLRGGWSEAALLSFPADVLILDEFDRLDNKAVALAQRRLNASVFPRRVAISTPTLPGLGIDGLYNASDKREYEQECPYCHEWHVYEYFRDVRASESQEGQPYWLAPGWPQVAPTRTDAVTFDHWRYWSRERLLRAHWAVHCPSCQTPLTRDDRCLPGRWVARQPDADTHGYRIPALAFPHIDLSAIALALTSSDPLEVQEGYRSDLGMAYQPAGSSLTEGMIHALSAPLENGQLPDLEGRPMGGWHDTTMGVDVGARFHYRVTSRGPGGLLYVRAMGSVHEWADLDTLLSIYKVRRCVVDSQPELHAAEAWSQKHSGIVFRAMYPSNTNALAGLLFRQDHEGDRISINRTMAMDAVYATIAQQKELWPSDITYNPEVLAHLMAPIRVVGTNDQGQEITTWTHTGPDHFYHAMLYDLVARESLPAEKIASLAMGASRSRWGSPGLTRDSGSRQAHILNATRDAIHRPTRTRRSHPIR